jgi:hypothetical protein
MKKNEFFKFIRKDYPQKLEKKWDGSCPCFTASPVVDGYKIELRGHCWRTCMECKYNGLHVKSKMPKKELKEIVKEIKKELDKQKWYSKWEIVFE